MGEPIRLFAKVIFFASISEISDSEFTKTVATRTCEKKNRDFRKSSANRRRRGRVSIMFCVKKKAKIIITKKRANSIWRKFRLQNHSATVLRRKRKKKKRKPRVRRRPSVSFGTPCAAESVVGAKVATAWRAANHLGSGPAAGFIFGPVDGGRTNYFSRRDE